MFLNLCESFLRSLLLKLETQAFALHLNLSRRNNKASKGSHLQFFSFLKSIWKEIHWFNSIIHVLLTLSQKWTFDWDFHSKKWMKWSSFLCTPILCKRGLYLFIPQLSDWMFIPKIQEAHSTLLLSIDPVIWLFNFVHRFNKKKINVSALSSHHECPFPF